MNTVRMGTKIQKSVVRGLQFCLRSPFAQCPSNKERVSSVSNHLRNSWTYIDWS